MLLARMAEAHIGTVHVSQSPLPAFSRATHQVGSFGGSATESRDYTQAKTAHRHTGQRVAMSPR